jgi:predicted RNase H-like HicB family nuclease
MITTPILSGYITAAMDAAVYDRLDDGSYAGRIPPCQGVIAFGGSLKEVERELQTTLEEWVRLGLKLGHSLPVLDALDLNQVEDHVHEPVDTL